MRCHESFEVLIDSLSMRQWRLKQKGVHVNQLLSAIGVDTMLDDH